MVKKLLTGLTPKIKNFSNRFSKVMTARLNTTATKEYFSMQSDRDHLFCMGKSHFSRCAALTVGK